MVGTLAEVQVDSAAMVEEWRERLQEWREERRIDVAFAFGIGDELENQTEREGGVEDIRTPGNFHRELQRGLGFPESVERHIAVRETARISVRNDALW